MIDIQNISSGYGKKIVVKNLSASFNKGKLTSIIGPNGSGKSTLLKTVLGIVPRTDGDAFIDGESIFTLKRKEISRRISYLSQEQYASDMTVFEAVLHGRFPHLSFPKIYSSKDEKIAKEAMEEVGILNLRDLPLSSLSSGMKQTAYIATALAQEADYILLDEPNTYLDISHQIELMRLLRRLADGGRGIVAIMHDLPMALSFSDEILVMENGEAVFSGSSDEVCSCGIIERVFGISVCKRNEEYSYVIK